MKLKVSEVFYSAQGEGRFVGVPSVFLRTFGCNFTCSGFGCKPGEKTTEIEPIIADIEANPNKYKSFEVLPLVHTGCDSYASWHPKFKDFSPMLEIDAVVNRCKDTIPSKDWKTPNGNHTHLVITGGEPLLGWQRAYGELLNHPDMLNLSDLTFETNGTQELSETFKDMLDEWVSDIKFSQANFGHWREITFSVSPKLSVSGEKWEEAIRPEIIADYQRFGVTYLKFVVEKMEDFDEVDRAVAQYRQGGFMGVVYVMPVGGTTMLYDGNRVSVADEAMKRGYYYSPRLHVDLWGNGWGK